MRVGRGHSAVVLAAIAGAHPGKPQRRCRGSPRGPDLSLCRTSTSLGLDLGGEMCVHWTLLVLICLGTNSGANAVVPQSGHCTLSRITEPGNATHQRILVTFLRVRVQVHFSRTARGRFVLGVAGRLQPIMTGFSTT